VVSHEVIELFGDIDVNDYDDGPESGHGMCYAHELCDPCEADGYTVKLPDDTAVLVSNFVLPAWFDQNAPAGSLFDFMGTCKAPFTMSAGGYMVVRNAPGSEQQVFGEVAPPAWRLEGKRRPGSRTARRMGIGE
jgi:hypothetical protein